MKVFIFVMSAFIFAGSINAQETTTTPAPSVNFYQDPNANEKWIKSQCSEPYQKFWDAQKEAKKNAKEDSKELREKIIELEKEKVEKESQTLEAVENAQKAAKDAEVDFEKAKTDITEALNTLEEETNTQATEMVRALQDDISKLEENLTTERDTVNNEYENAKNQGYEQCKAQAEQLYISKMGLNQKTNQSKNLGLKKTGGASFASGSEIKKIKSEAIKFHAKCVSEVTRTLDASRTTNIKKLDSTKKRIEQEINTKRVELDRLTNSQYNKKVASLHEKLRVAGVELQNAQTKAQQEAHRLQNQATKEKMVADQEIMVLKEEFARKKDGNFLDEDTSALQANAKSACCDLENNTPNDSGKGVVSSSFCAKEKRSKRSSRKSGKGLR